MNIAIHIGNLARDPELRYTPGGAAICSITVALSESYKKADGERCEKSHFFNWTAFGKQGEVMNQYFHKGKPIWLQGRADFQQWETEGNKRSAVKFIVEKWGFIGSKGEKTDVDPDKAAAPVQQEAAPVSDIDEEEIPF
jgi:single-strand DNA-binding protein